MATRKSFESPQTLTVADQPTKNLSNSPGDFALATMAQTGNSVPDGHLTGTFWEYSNEGSQTSDSIDASRWNKNYPYQLLVLREETDRNTGGTHYVAQEGWSFVLPIPPESLSIQTPFAISTQITLGGVVEEHNGAPIRLLSFSGTTGVWPNRPRHGSVAEYGGDVSKMPPDVRDLSQGFAFGLLAGTIQAGTALSASMATSLGQYPLDNRVSETVFSSTSNSLRFSTGYYQFRLLQKFLESYVTLKTKSENKNLRLAVAIWKDQSIYLVTPVAFEMRRNAQDPLAYHYAMQFRAWRRISQTGVRQGDMAYSPTVNARNDRAGAFAQVLNTSRALRSVIAASRSVAAALGSDIEAPLTETCREIGLWASSIAGTAVAIAEMPASIISSVVSTFIQSLDRVVSAGKSLNNVGRTYQALDRYLDGVTGTSALRTAQLALWLETPEGQQVFDAARAMLGSSQTTALTSEAFSPDTQLQVMALLAAVAEDPVGGFDVLSGLDLNAMKISRTSENNIQAEIDRVNSFTTRDIEDKRDLIMRIASDLADAIGAGSDAYNGTYSRPTVTKQRQATEEDFEILFAMNETVRSLNAAIATMDDTRGRPDALEYVAGLARRSGIAFSMPVSKVAVPYPYGATLEQVSLQYLGDANRWHEIASLNGLRAPYVDEEGFELPLLTNGVGNQLTVGDASKLYVGQPITITSASSGRTKRRIVGIDRISDSMAFVYVDGGHDMDRFTTSGRSTVHAFLPDTVNSSMQIYIPSTESVPEELTTKKIPGVDDYAKTLRQGGVDLLLTPSGDLAMTQDGDCKLALGITNLVQRVRIAVGTPRGSLPQHPDFGLGLRPGISTADLDAKSLVQAAQGMFASDPTFNAVIGARVVKNGPAAQLTLSVQVAGQDFAMPIRVDVEG